ncbi:serine/threonine-protein kinase RIO3-like [Lingula anatina]|uniref:Serine/threonine-protein kinase RIO3 n=1 Tax=Lingula anatina TaxID=7574 RepID=A0A1S3IY87_LINAN|nr:serine/threonine-protein kinase RIO3-like [Lingula anatina]|eukprot:XP_013403160.2 serine/threonine-protein kinase RIO3-like [Lingula anatina]
MDATVMESSQGPINTPSVWGKTSSPWGTATTPTICSLEEVMSEELAHELQERDEEDVSKRVINVQSEAASEPVPDLSAILPEPGSETNEDSDFLLAQLLQLEYDKEHDLMLSKEEAKLNGQSKVSLSFSNYRTVHPYVEEDSDSEDDDLTWVTNVYKDEPVPNFNKAGYSGKGKNITTKHDPVICGKRNVSKMEKFPPEFETGDGKGMDLKLPNHVFNKLKQHSVSENKKSQRLHEKKEHSTAQQAVDPKTRLILYKLVNAGILDNVTGVISTGKESVVFHADGGSLPDRTMPTECAIKVFKTTLNEFKTREKYIRGDFRFAKDEFKKQNPRKIIKMWTEKELVNLSRMRKFGLHCPEPILMRKHVLVMSFVGHNRVPAPKLKEAHLSAEQLQNAYAQCVEAMKTMFKDCGLVHADLSEYNILWHNGSIWFIDVSQSVDVQHPHAHEFLLRDCGNVTQFFTKQGVPDVLDQHQLFNDITGLRLTGEGREFLAQIQEYEKQEEFLRSGMSRKDYAFDFFFNRSVQERANKEQESKDKKEIDIDKI